MDISFAFYLDIHLIASLITIMTALTALIKWFRGKKKGLSDAATIEKTED